MDNVRWVGSPNFTPGRSGVTHITLHIMAGFLAGTDRVFSDPGSQTSSNYGIGRDGTVHQYVSEDDTSWADGNAYSNAASISIEHEGGIPEAECTTACMDASAQLMADIARRQGWTILVHDGTRGNVWLHREVPGSTHPTCPDLAPNGLNVDYVVSRANQILQNNTQEEDMMSLKDDTINYGGGQYSAAYAIEDLGNKLTAIGSAQDIARAVLYYSDSGRIEDTPLYELRAINHNLEKVSEQLEQLLKK